MDPLKQAEVESEIKEIIADLERSKNRLLKILEELSEIDLRSA